MNHMPATIIISVIAVAAILAGTYEAFFALAAHFPPGRTLGLIGAALMLVSGLACVGVGYLAIKWLKHHSDTP